MDKSRRNGVEIDHSRSLARNIINHYVVDLRVAMEHALLELAGSLGLLKAKGKIAALLDEFSQTLCLDGCTQKFARLRLLESLVVCLKVSARYVEAGQRVLDGRRIHVAYEVVEVTQRRATLHCMLRPLGDIEGMRTHYSRYYAPNVAFFVHSIVRAILRPYYARHLPYAVVATCLCVGLQPFVAVLSHLVHVLHDDFRLGEHVAVDSLKYNLRLGEGVTVYREVSIVDVAAADRLQCNKAALYIEQVYQDREFHRCVSLLFSPPCYSGLR